MKVSFELNTNDMKEIAKKLEELRDIERTLTSELRGISYEKCEDWFNSRPEKMAF
jgi:hypothetical protein